MLVEEGGGRMGVCQFLLGKSDEMCVSYIVLWGHQGFKYE